MAGSGIPEYLTRIVASPLAWIEDANDRDLVWDRASARLAERSGRTGMPSLTRSFKIELGNSTSQTLQIHEPALTSDNLGLKTWGSAYTVANNLHQLKEHLAGRLCRTEAGISHKPSILELGAGTGLVGLSVSCAWSDHVLMTDLPAIVPNLRRNADLNADAINAAGGAISTAVLDWTNPQEPLKACDAAGSDYTLFAGQDHFDVVIAADPIYDESHPEALAATVDAWLATPSGRHAYFILAYPLRQAYSGAVHELAGRLRSHGLALVVQQQESGRDDWQDEITVEWSVWSHTADAATF